MKAAVVTSPGRFAIEDVADPTCPADGVIIRVEATTICPSDIKRSHKADLPQPPPRILGHELAGTIVEVGSQASGWRVGERVGAAPRMYCGECPPCRADRTNLCYHNTALGWHVAGSFAEYIAVPGRPGKEVLEHLPEALSFAAAALAEPLACALNSVEVAGIGPGDDVVIIGMGSQGVMQAQLAKEKGARSITGIMRSPQRSDAVRHCASALTDLIISNNESPVERVKELTDGLGASVVMVSATSADALSLATQLVRFGGRICIHASMPTDNAMLTTDANRIHYQEWTITGSSSFQQRHYRECLELLARQVVDPQAMIGATLPLAEIERGVTMMEQREALKVCLQP